MKTSMLTAALLAAFTLTACAADTPADTTADADAVGTEVAESAPVADAGMAYGDASAATGDVVDGAIASPDHTTLVAAVQAAGLVDTLKGTGPFTVFAPTNAAFDKLPAGTVDGLLTPERRDDLTGVLTYHVVPGNVDAATLVQQIEAGGGSATLTTVQGGTLTARADGGTVTLTDAQGGTSTVTTADLRQSNGVIHVIDTVLMP
ncbi:fasciclin domain-containing protein [Luteimonas aestuarii]|uniref:Fasciclin domain-containing protein n=1 Tax=Luteimonas aestuarii TaxID=453837 RepID=A0A4R5TMI0_9GAMM|nr:fasciclin domain-containing protein [Luteimonas aestuarii]TDK23809.1 fasciclin domain-containing protein [Luteimonas aestuarii]